ncbi:MAG: hypothetical protein JNK85_04470 [Verrucomicrobiales bacterium]|nr:hypothetical protein [Verrucomicrobiales bacterium]
MGHDVGGGEAFIATARTIDQGVVKARAKPGKPAAQPLESQRNVPSPQDWVLVLERLKP